MANQVITAPMAVLKVQGFPIAFCRGIRVNENMQRGEVRQLGSILPVEMPILAWSGTVSLTFYNIDFSISQLPGAIQRQVNTLQDFQNYLIFQRIS